MKYIKQLWCACGWWYIGLRFRKAWQLAGHNVRKSSAKTDLLIICAILFAYVIVAWNDEAEAQVAAHTAQVAKNKAEANLSHCFNGGSFDSADGIRVCDKVYLSKRTM